MKRTVLSFAVVLTAVVGFAGTAQAGDSVTAVADLNGDGKRETVTAQIDPANPAEQVLTAKIKGRTITARTAVDDRVGLQPMDVTDVNDDGREEIVVTEIVGANTLHFSLWALTGGELRAVTLDGVPFRFYEGGGLSAISAFRCDDHQFVTIGAQRDWDTGIYSGERVTYALESGAFQETSRIAISGLQGDPVFQHDPQSC